MKTIFLSGLAVAAMSSVAFAEVPNMSHPGPARLTDAQLDGVTAGHLNFVFNLDVVNQINVINQITTVNITQQCTGLECSLFGGSIFVAPTGCGGFGAEFGC